MEQPLRKAPLSFSFGSPPVHNDDMQPTLLRLKAPFMITDEITFDDRIKLLNKEKEEKARMRADLEKKLHLKTHATPMLHLCMDLDSEHIFTHSVLEKIHSPRDYEQRGVRCRQKISDLGTTRTDVISLKKELDKRLKEFGTEEVGLCKKRQDLYSQCFDEIIRQVSISCVERGKLLLAVRDEINLTFAAYESLFSSAIAYGIRKQLKLQNNIEVWKKKIRDVNSQISEIETIKAEFEPTYTHFETKFSTQMEADKTEFESEHERLVKNNKVLKRLLLNSVRGNKAKDEDDAPKLVAGTSYEFARKLSQLNKEQPIEDLI